MNYPNFHVTVPVGSKVRSEWITEDMVQVQAIATAVPQIVVTPGVRPLDRSDRGAYNLTHLDSGYLLLRGFPSIHAAREAAVRLDNLFHFRDWAFMDPREIAKDIWRTLAPEDQSWLHEYGGPRISSVPNA